MRVCLREEYEREVDRLKREISMRDVDCKLHEAKLRIMKDENTKVRMQLRDPSNIKRAPLSTDLNQPAEIIDEFERVQKNYDMLTLQEELKQMIIENSLLKDKIVDIQDRWKRVEVKRDALIKDLKN